MIKNKLNQEIVVGDIAICWKYGPEFFVIRKITQIPSYRAVEDYSRTKVGAARVSHYQPTLWNPELGQYVKQPTPILIVKNITRVGGHTLMKLETADELYKYDISEEIIRKLKEVQCQIKAGVYMKKKENVIDLALSDTVAIM